MVRPRVPRESGVILVFGLRGNMGKKEGEVINVIVI